METSSRIVWSSFFVRLWRETAEGEWHGQIVHLQTEASRHFAGPEVLQEFIFKHAPGFEAQTVDSLDDSGSFDEGLGN